MAKTYAWVNLDTGEFGTTESWAECENKVKGKKGFRYKSFKNEIGAEEWLLAGAEYETKGLNAKNENKTTIEINEEAIYFDAGTGGVKEGCEVRITNSKKESLLKEVVKDELINEKGNIHLKEKTNNFGELLGFYFATTLALMKGIKLVCGDSKIVIDYWTEGNYSKGLPEETINLIKDCVELKRKFLENGGNVMWISGNSNYADLGYHINK